MDWCQEHVLLGGTSVLQGPCSLSRGWGSNGMLYSLVKPQTSRGVCLSALAEGKYKGGLTNFASAVRCVIVPVFLRDKLRMRSGGGGIWILRRKKVTRNHVRDWRVNYGTNTRWFHSLAMLRAHLGSEVVNLEWDQPSGFCDFLWLHAPALAR